MLHDEGVLGNDKSASWGLPNSQVWALCMQERSHEARGNKDYVESPWESSAEELERFLLLAPQEQADRERPTPELPQYKGRLRKTTCTGFGMGLKATPPHSALHPLLGCS